MPEVLAPAYYAARTTGWRRDVWALLHPPYTAWHLSYVLIGASLAPTVSLTRLVATLLAFFLAVGVAAHALDELRGRPLQTELPAGGLWAAAVIGLLGAVALGIAQGAFAYALEDGWARVEELDELREGYQKKEYRNPENYKALFRDFNEIFEGVQKQRPRSNPTHLKA